VHAVLASSSPSPTTSPSGDVHPIATAMSFWNSADSWLHQHWQGVVTIPLTILLIVVIALVVRTITVRMIHRAIKGMTSREVGQPGKAKFIESSLFINAERRRQRAETMGSILVSIASFTIFGIAFLTVLGQLKVNLAPVLASAGIVGVAVGFGARNLVTDFLSGVFMMLEDQYGVGDSVDLGSATGTVEAVTLRVTRLRDADGAVWYVRNGEIKRVANKTQGWAQATVDIPVAASEDLERVRALVGEVADKLSNDEAWAEKIMGTPLVGGVEALAGDRMVLRVQLKTEAGKDAPVARELRARLKQTFDRENVTLADTLSSS
jgi:small conductance mechanosensitive channel